MKHEYVSQADRTHTLVKISFKNETPSFEAWKCLDGRDYDGREKVHSLKYRRWRMSQTEMIKALRCMSYANRPLSTPVLQGDRGVRKGKLTIKVMY